MSSFVPLHVALQVQKAPPIVPNDAPTLDDSPEVLNNHPYWSMTSSLGAKQRSWNTTRIEPPRWKNEWRYVGRQLGRILCCCGLGTATLGHLTTTYYLVSSLILSFVWGQFIQQHLTPIVNRDVTDYPNAVAAFLNCFYITLLVGFIGGMITWLPVNYRRCCVHRKRRIDRTWFHKLDAQARVDDPDAPNNDDAYDSDDDPWGATKYFRLCEWLKGLECPDMYTEEQIIIALKRLDQTCREIKEQAGKATHRQKKAFEALEDQIVRVADLPAFAAVITNAPILKLDLSNLTNCKFEKMRDVEANGGLHVKVI